MKNLKINIITYFFLFVSFFLFGQIEQYKYKRALNGITDQWHELTIPNEIFEKIATNFNDLRIFGITATNDTIQAPFLLKVSSDKVKSEQINFKIINTSFNTNGYYFTFQIAESKTINQIKLDFLQPNFDWKVALEGSNNQQEWFTIIDKYRILSIKNESIDFQFTDLQFSNSNYHFYRLFIDSKETPILQNAFISKNEVVKGSLKKYDIQKMQSKKNKELRQTEIDIELPMKVPISFIKLKTDMRIDFYRPISIMYVSDSIQTDDGYKYMYQQLTSGIFNSISDEGFLFESTLLQKLKIIIRNHDNQPLKINSILIEGYEYNLQIRFSENATYFLAYGNEFATKPSYDINYFKEKVPANLKPLYLGNEQFIERKNNLISEPWFVNKLWLWSIMIVIIIVLGWFSLKMIQDK